MFIVIKLNVTVPLTNFNTIPEVFFTLPLLHEFLPCGLKNIPQVKTHDDIIYQTSSVLVESATTLKLLEYGIGLRTQHIGLEKFVKICRWKYCLCRFTWHI